MSQGEDSICLLLREKGKILERGGKNRLIGCDFRVLQREREEGSLSFLILIKIYIYIGDGINYKYKEQKINVCLATWNEIIIKNYMR